MSCTRLLPFLIFLLVAAPASGDDDLIVQIRHEFAGELYPLQKLAPGYERPATPAPTFAVGEFQTDDDTLRIWSLAIAEILRLKIQYVPNVRLTMPAPYYTASDAGAEFHFDRPLLTTREQFKGLYDALGIKAVLTGTLNRTGDEFLIDAALVDGATGEQSSTETWRATLAELPDALIGISTWVYDELGVELSRSERAHLENTATLRPAAIAAFVESFEDLHVLELVVRQDLLVDLRDAHPDFALFVLYALHAKAYPTNLQEARENLELAIQARAEYPGHAGVALESYRTMDLSSQPKHEEAKRLAGLRDLAVANPHDSMIMINFANAYGEMGSVYEAISLGLEITERWPDNYRAWWSLGWMVSKYAWQVRTEKMWSEVPEPARKRFKLMSYVSDQAIDRALAMHNSNGALWLMKLSSVGSNGGYSAELMHTFDMAASLAPTHEPIYASALNFSQNKWGGNAAARRHVIELAEQNNPDAAWPKFMRSQHEVDFEGLKVIADAVEDELALHRLLENPNFWKLLFGIIAAALILIMYLSIRRSTKWMDRDPNDFRYQAGLDKKGGDFRELSQEEMLERLKAENHRR